jgi:flagellar basal body-associated protein FliL
VNRRDRLEIIALTVGCVVMLVAVLAFTFWASR